MYKTIVSFFEMIGIPAWITKLVGVATIVGSLTIAGYNMVLVMNMHYEIQSEILNAQKILLSKQQMILNQQSTQEETLVMLISYLSDFSVAFEETTNDMIRIYRETARDEYNTKYVEHLEEGIRKVNSTSLPHHRITVDTVKITIGVRPIKKK
jgi:hypothetical protein